MLNYMTTVSALLYHIRCRNSGNQCWWIMASYL